MNVVLLFVLFAAPIVTGAGIGVWSWWWPRHQLDRLFAERKRERVAVARIPQTPEPLPHLEPIVA